MPVKLACTLSDRFGSIRYSTVNAVVEAPEGNRYIVALHDDGGFGDSVANDGVYEGIFRETFQGNNRNDIERDEIPLSGIVNSNYAVTVFVEGRTNRGEEFTLEDSEGFHLYELFKTAIAFDQDNDSLPDRWEELYGLDRNVNDAEFDFDGDRLSNRTEYERGTDPTRVDSDFGGESDASEINRNADPNDPNDDLIQRPSTPSILASHQITHVPVNELLVPEKVLIQYSFPDDAAELILERADSPSGPFEPVATLTRSVEDFGVYVDENVELMVPYYYRLQAFTADKDSSDYSESAVGIAKEDPYPPIGRIVINNNAQIADSEQVLVRIVSTDSIEDFRISTTADLDDEPWIPFDGSSSSIQLQPITTSDSTFATVFVELRDESDNISPVLSKTIFLDLDGDFDGDGISNRNDDDDDNDTVSDRDELELHGTNPFNRDSDLDGFGDGEEIQMGTNPVDNLDFPPLVQPTPTPIVRLLQLTDIVVIDSIENPVVIDSIDTDEPSERELSIQWNYSSEIEADVIVYVSSGSEGFQFLGLADARQEYYQWKPGGLSLTAGLGNGPQDSEAYTFNLFLIPRMGSDLNAAGPLTTQQIIYEVVERVPQDSVIVTTGPNSYQDLSGTVAVADPTRNRLVVRWNFEVSDVRFIYVYVSVDDGRREFLGIKRDVEQQYLVWEEGNSELIFSKRSGPEAGYEYRFSIFLLRNEGPSRFEGPYSTDGAVSYVEGSFGVPTVTPLIPFPVVTATPTATFTPMATPSPTRTVTPTFTPSPTMTPTVTFTPTARLVPTATPDDQPRVWMSDDLKDIEDRSGKVDVDPDDDIGFAIRWSLPGVNVRQVRVYLQVGGSRRIQSLVNINDESTTAFYWTKGLDTIHSQFADGPVPGEEYRVVLFVSTTELNSRSIGPLYSDGGITIEIE